MILGHGDIASVLKDRDGFIFFASGVSNSQTTDELAYSRERQLLMKQDRSKHLVYFSSLAVFLGKDTRYFQHKREMENTIKSYFDNYTIVRLGNITWGTNPHTLINSLRLKKKNGETFEVRDEYKYIVDQDEFLYWIGLIPSWSCEMNIPGKRLTVQQVIEQYVNT
jgi:hypothetical protein